MAFAGNSGRASLHATDETRATPPLDRDFQQPAVKVHRPQPQVLCFPAHREGASPASGRQKAQLPNFFTFTIIPTLALSIGARGRGPESRL